MSEVNVLASGDIAAKVRAEKRRRRRGPLGRLKDFFTGDLFIIGICVLVGLAVIQITCFGGMTL